MPATGTGLRVGIDLTALRPRGTGVNTYLTELLAHIGSLESGHRYTVFVNRNDRATVEALVPADFRVTALSMRPRAARLAFQQLALPVAAARRRLDVVHSPVSVMPLARGRQRHMLTIHDMTPFSLPRHQIRRQRSAWYRRAVLSSIRRADLVAVPSRSVKRAIRRFAPAGSARRIEVIPLGVGAPFGPRPEAEVEAARERLGLPERYILYLGAIEPRKQVERLVEAYRRLVAANALDHDLVLAGELGFGSDRLRESLGAPELARRVHLVGHVGNADLPLLYAGAALFVYPSLEEGFGLPPLEAMACGVPTIATRTSSLEENLEGAAELVDPTSTEQLVAAIRRLLADPGLRARRAAQGLERATGFRWEQTARRTVACYEELAAVG